MKLKSLIQYPCQWDDLVDENMTTKVTVYTLKEVEEDEDCELNSPGISKGKDDVFDIVVDAPELTETIIKNSLKELTKLTKITYEFAK